MNIGVAIPTYNRNLYLCKLLSSIPSHIPVSVSDNGNYVTKDIEQQYPNAVFSHHKEVLDVFDNWNAAATRLNTDWSVIPSDDDVFFPEAFEVINNYINKYVDADLLIFGHQIIDEHDALSKGWQPQKEMVCKAPLGFEPFMYGVDARMPAVVFKTSLLKTLNYFDGQLKLTAGDSDLIQRALLAGKTVFIPECIGAYRIWSGGLTSKRNATKQWMQEIDYWQDKIGRLVEEHKTLPINVRQLKDEVYGRNVLSALQSLKTNGTIKNRIGFILNNRFPWRATWKTQAGILLNTFN